jgi:putative methyltransferase (TIGR04325 family)
MMSAKELVKLIFSDYLISKIASISYGWHGNYKSWESAKAKCTGYDDIDIFNKVRDTSRRVKTKELAFERDSVPFEKIDYSFPLLAGLMWIAYQNKGKLNVMDFGGSLGTSYYQNMAFLNSLSEVHWCIVEQPHFVREGQRSFSDEKLEFFNSAEECLNTYQIDLVLLSNIIHYLEKPYNFLEEIISKNIKYIFIDRTLLLPGLKERLTIQKVPKKIYKARYCCWLLSETKFLKLFSDKYDLIFDFNVNGNINIRSLFKGYLFKQKDKAS